MTTMKTKPAGRTLACLQAARKSESMRIQLPSGHASTFIALADRQRISTAC